MCQHVRVLSHALDEKACINLKIFEPLKSSHSGNISLLVFKPLRNLLHNHIVWFKIQFSLPKYSYSCHYRWFKSLHNSLEHLMILINCGSRHFTFNFCSTECLYNKYITLYTVFIRISSAYPHYNTHYITIYPSESPLHIHTKYTLLCIHFIVLGIIIIFIWHFQHQTMLRTNWHQH